MLTLGNLLCGFAAVLVAAHPESMGSMEMRAMTLASLLVFLGMGFDALDGGVARLTRSVSPMGAQLDSMADMVTFGVAPAFLVVQLVGVESFGLTGDAAGWRVYFDRAALAVAGVYVACAGLRLARFNLEQVGPSGQSATMFDGLPTPGAAGVVVSLTLVHQQLLDQQASSVWAVIVPGAMVVLTLLAAVMMVSSLRYVHVTKRYLKRRVSWPVLATLVIMGLLATIDLQLVLAVGFSVYALSGPSAWGWRRLRRRIAD